MTEVLPDNAEETAHYEDIKIACLLSCPMVGWNPHWGCVAEAVRPFQIPIRLGYGAYWHQTMSNMLEDCIDDGLDWVLTLDYDSMFFAPQLDHLIRTLGQNSHIDALAALECKRSSDEVPLFTISGQTAIEVDGNPFKVTTAHFGMTLIRLDALKKVPKPWMVGTPDASGSYRTLQRTDADIDFWHKWNKAGNTVYVDPKCSVGHLQPMVSQFDEHFKPQHIHVVDWRQQHRRRA